MNHFRSMNEDFSRDFQFVARHRSSGDSFDPFERHLIFEIENARDWRWLFCVWTTLNIEHSRRHLNTIPSCHHHLHVGKLVGLIKTKEFRIDWFIALLVTTRISLQSFDDRSPQEHNSSNKTSIEINDFEVSFHQKTKTSHSVPDIRLTGEKSARKYLPAGESAIPSSISISIGKQLCRLLPSERNSSDAKWKW